MLSRRGHQYHRYLWSSETSASFLNPQVDLTLLTKFKALILAKKKKKVFFCPTRAEFRGKVGPDAISNFTPSYHRHHIFLAKPCDNPSPNWCSRSLTHSSQPEQPFFEQPSPHQKRTSLQIPKPVQKTPNFASAKQHNTFPAETRHLLRQTALKSGVLCYNFN